MFLFLSVALLLAGVQATSRYDTLFRGAAHTSDAAFPGALYWRSDDGEWLGFGYHGIKYANAKRFEPSTVNFDHGYLRNGSRLNRGPICPQLATQPPYSDQVVRVMNEDCLGLDVYVPPVYKHHNSLGWGKWPVLVWIHGGDFRMGSKDAFDAGELAAAIGAVVVVPNYRVGPFGFLSSGDNNAPGNWALYDLKLALKWIHSHAHSFCGDKSKITIAGERAGGALVSMLLLDEDVRNLVHGAITMSGNVFSPWAIQRDPVTVANVIAADLACPNETAAMISCLKRVSAVDLLQASARAESTLGRYGLVTPLWAPVVDGMQIQFSPKWLTEGSALNWKGGYVTGYLTNDALVPLLMNVPRVFGHGMIDHDWIVSSFIPSILDSIMLDCKDPRVRADNAQKIYSRYNFAHFSQHDDLRKLIIRLTTDVYFAVPAMRESAMYAKKSVSGLGNQMYVVSSDDSFDMESLLPIPEVMHLFGLKQEGMSSSQNRSSEAVTREIRRLVGHVVRHGNAFGSQFNPKLGNRLLLGSRHEWRTDYVNGLLEGLTSFWNDVMEMQCTSSQGNY